MERTKTGKVHQFAVLSETSYKLTHTHTHTQTQHLSHGKSARTKPDTYRIRNLFKYHLTKSEFRN